MERGSKIEGVPEVEKARFPKTAYALNAIPRALAQGITARVATCAYVGASQRWQRATTTPNYCLTKGVLIKDQALITQSLADHVEQDLIKEGEVTPEMVEDYNLHYWRQLLAKQNVPLPLLRTDDPLQVLYPTNNGQLPPELGSVNTVDYLTEQASNWDEVVTTLEAERPQIENLLETESLALMTNHSSWPNIPFLVAALHRVYGIPLSKFNILLGPALTTFEQGLELARIGNIIKTIPPTPNGQLPQHLKDLEKKITGHSTRKIREILKNPGNILVYCPFGTTDKKDKETGELVLDAMDERVLKFQRMIGSMAPIIPVGTYDLEAFNGAQILTPGRVNLSFGKLRNRRSIKTDKDQLEVARDLARNIVDYEGDSVGKLRLPTVEIIGAQGQFGAALTHVFQRHAADKCFDVIGVTRKEAESQETRDRPEIIIVTAPSWAKTAIRNYIQKNPNSTIVLTAKGIDAVDLYQELSEEEAQRVIIFSGPNKADQIGKNEPSAAVIAGTDAERVDRVHGVLNGPNFRLYQSNSPHVIQLSGVLKNLIVLELGRVWRQLDQNPEQKRAVLIKALDAAYSVVKKEAPDNENPEEFWGIAGLGDILLCLPFFEGAEGSRNFRFGRQTAQNPDREASVHKNLGTVEGIETSHQFNQADSWLETPEIKTFRTLLQTITSGDSLETPQLTENQEVVAMFTAIFSKLEDICREKSFTENTRAWAFCRLHREMQIAFPQVHKKDILQAMCQAVIGQETELQGTLDLSHFTELEGQNTPILKAFSELNDGNSSVDAIMKRLLASETKFEGF